MTRKSDLPFGSEFSPVTVDLGIVLDIVVQHCGDQAALEAALKQRFFDRDTTTEANKRKLAMNLRLSLAAYGLIDARCCLTELGEHLLSIREDVPKRHAELARHILLNLHGLTLIQCLKDMELGGESVTLVNLRRWLGERGVHFPRGGKHPSMMRLWLEKAGVFTSGWRVNEERIKELTGVSTQEMEALSQMPSAQRAYLKALANLDPDGAYLSNEVEKLASITYGVEFNEKGLAREVLYPLQDAGFITLERGTKEPGRGAKPFVVTPTAKFQAEVLLPILEQIEQQIHADLRPLLRKPLADVLSELDHEQKHVRGLALEALAIKLMRTVGLDYVATRLRGEATGGAEVDVIFESTRLVFTRWQVQCKNTSRVSLDDVAKEVGLTHTLKSNAVVIISTGRISDAARRYANRVMPDSNLAIIMMDQTDLSAITANRTFIVSVLQREARHALDLKKLDVLK